MPDAPPLGGSGTDLAMREQGWDRPHGSRHQGLELGRRQGGGEVEALGHLASHGAQWRKLLGTLHTFGNGDRTAASGEVGNAGDHRLGASIGIDIGDQRAVHLDDGERQAGQLLHRGEAGPEVVNG